MHALSFALELLTGIWFNPIDHWVSVKVRPCGFQIGRSGQLTHGSTVMQPIVKRDSNGQWLTWIVTMGQSTRYLINTRIQRI